MDTKFSLFFADIFFSSGAPAPPATGLEGEWLFDYIKKCRVLTAQGNYQKKIILFQQ